MNLYDNVTLVTYCCPKDIHKIYAPGALKALVDSFNSQFHEIIFIRQRCRDIDVGLPEVECRILETEDYPDIRKEFNILEDNPMADQHTGSPTAKYWWRNMCCNPLIGLKEATTEYVMLSDCDIVLQGADETWVARAIDKLKSNSQILMVSPGHGLAHDDMSQSISQIVALVDRNRFLHIDYEAPLPPNVSWGAFHFVWEGRVWRYVMVHNLRRLLLANPRIIHYAW